jgi:hypothetical protein
MDDIREIVQAAVQEVVQEAIQGVVQQFLPQKAEIEEERKRREGLEQRVHDLIAENEKARAKADEAERSAGIRAELQRQGVAKLDLAYKALKDDIPRGEDGKFIGMRERIEQFVKENPELLPARLAGGSGAGAGQRSAPAEAQVDLETIRPGMSPEELDRVRKEIARVASLTLRGW